VVGSIYLNAQAENASLGVSDISLGWCCGRFSCYRADIIRAGTPRGWFEGSVISVVAEPLMEAHGARTQAYHITPLVLHTIRGVLDGHQDVGVSMKWVNKQVEPVRLGLL